MRRTFALLATVTLFAALIGCGGSGDTTTADSGAATPPPNPGPPPGMAQPAAGGGASAAAVSSEGSGMSQETSMSAETGSSDEGESMSSETGEAGYVPPQEGMPSGTLGPTMAGPGGPPPGYSMAPATPGGGYPPGYPGSGPPPGYSMAPATPGSGPPPGYTTGGPPPGYPGYPGAGYSGSEEMSSETGESPYAGSSMMPYPGGGYPGAPGGPTPPPPPGFDGLAEMAFQQGREADAFKYLWAFALLNDEGASDVLPKVEWVSGLKGPTLAVRWGVGVQITPDSHKTDVKPVGVNQQLPGKNRGQASGGGAYGEGGASMGDYGPSGGAGGGNANAQFSRYAGELGERFLNEFQTRVLDGKFGQVLRDAPASGRGRGTGGLGGGEYGESGSYGGSMPYGASEGSGYGPGMMPGGVGGGGRPLAPNAALPITTGLSFLGVDAQEKLLSKAAREGLQIVVLVNIDIKVNLKTKLITNETELVLLDVAKKSELCTTAKFNNLKIQNDRSNNKKDGVQDEFNKLFKFVDENLVVSPLPTTLKPEHVQGRVSSLVAAKPDNLLPVLAEIRYWQRQNMLTEEQMTAAFKQLLGEDIGTQLATGDEEAKKKLLERWLPKA